MMKKLLTVCAFTAAALALDGCKTAPLPVYTLSIREKPAVVDIQGAEDSLGRLPSSLWVSARHVQIDPGVGYVSATIAKPDSCESENLLLLDLQGYNANHPMHPVHLLEK